ncbi:MAG: hypothetical protein Q4E62_04775 [Sutterellaceae bacterium]|nr:hypothetical protein [Sutterellaceae bacterium]
MKRLTGIQKFVRNTKGAVAIEFALIATVACGVGTSLVWGAWQLGDIYRQQNHLNIETAALAEILINRDETAVDPETNLTISVPLETTLPTDTTDAARLLQTAMTGKSTDTDRTVGIEVEYADTSTAGTNGTPEIHHYRAGGTCPKVENDTDFASFFYENGGRMTPAGDITPIKILRVKSCLIDKSAERLFQKIMMPSTLSSAFTAIRKNNEIE